MLLINLCPHPVTIFHRDGTTTCIPFSGQVARVEVARSPVMSVQGVTVNVPHNETIGLLPPKRGVMLIVSQQVRQAHPSRTDLVSPAEMVKNSFGQIIGCRSFDTNPTPGKSPAHVHDHVHEKFIVDREV